MGIGLFIVFFVKVEIMFLRVDKDLLIFLVLSRIVFSVLVLLIY